jgi:hypothetical protein
MKLRRRSPHMPEHSLCFWQPSKQPVDVRKFCQGTWRSHCYDAAARQPTSIAAEGI